MDNKVKISVGVTDHLPEDVQAMLLAQYSRDYGPIEERIPTDSSSSMIDKLRQSLRRYYIGYGHKSVGQLGGTTVFFEGVSQIAAKAIEDHPLFNGQESSTRYIDYSNQPMINFDNEYIKQIQERLRALYIKALKHINEKIRIEYPYSAFCADETVDSQANTPEKLHTKWNNACSARAFDICRGILPAGVVTNVGFKATFDVINDHLGELLCHPSKEIAEIAHTALLEAGSKYPDAIKDIGNLFRENKYKDTTYFYCDQLKIQNAYGSIFTDEASRTLFNLMTTDLKAEASEIRDIASRMLANLEVICIKPEMVDEFMKTLRKREKWQMLPRYLSSVFRFNIVDLLDFGSFRDLQRHRDGVCTMPLLTPFYGLHQWYIEQLGPEISSELNKIMTELSETFLAKTIVGDTSSETVRLQYAVPMAAMVPVDYVCDFNQLAYLIELRTGKTVHQTLRMSMQKMHTLLTMQSLSVDSFNIYPDMDEDNFTLKRGEQTFNGKFKLED